MPLLLLPHVPGAATAAGPLLLPALPIRYCPRPQLQVSSTGPLLPLVHCCYRRHTQQGRAATAIDADSYSMVTTTPVIVTASGSAWRCSIAMNSHAAVAPASKAATAAALSIWAEPRLAHRWTLPPRCWVWLSLTGSSF